MSESLVAKWLDDRASLTAEEAAELERVLATDADLALRVKDQLATDELLSRRLAVDRSNFEAQVAQRIAAGDGGAFTQSTLAAARRIRRWRPGWSEAAAAGLLIAALLFLLLRRDATAPGGTPASGRSGLRGEYFRNLSLKGEPSVRSEAKVDFVWRKSAGPLEGWTDAFSARLTGTLEPAYSERYTFRTRNDDGVRVWIDGKLVIDDWKGRPVVSENRGEIDLVAGKPVDLKVEYFNGGDIGVLQLFWSSAGQKEEIIPPSRLRSP